MPSIDPTQSNNILQYNVPTLERDAPEQKTCEERGETRLPRYKRESIEEEDEEHEEEERVGEQKKMKSTNKKRKDKESERDKRLLFYGRFD